MAEKQNGSGAPAGGLGAATAAPEDKPVVMTSKQYGLLMNLLTSVQERLDVESDLEKRIGEMQATIARQGADLAAAVKSIESATSETATHSKSMVEQISRLTEVRAVVDPEMLASLERRVSEMFDAKLANTPQEIAEGVARSIQPKLAQIAGMTFDGALKEFRDAKPKGQGLQIGIGLLNATMSAIALGILYLAVKNATPDKFQVEGEPGTTVKDGQGRVLARIEA